MRKAKHPQRTHRHLVQSLGFTSLSLLLATSGCESSAPYSKMEVQPAGKESPVVVQSEMADAESQSAAAAPIPTKKPRPSARLETKRGYVADQTAPAGRDSTSTHGARQVPSVAHPAGGGGAALLGASGVTKSVKRAKKRQAPSRRNRGSYGEKREADAPAMGRGDGVFSGRIDAEISPDTLVQNDALSTFAVDVDTAAYSIARRTLIAGRAPTPSLVRVEEFLNYFRYGYRAPEDRSALFSIEADGAASPVDGQKHILRVGIQAKQVSDRNRLPTNLVFLVDTSCSMTSQDKLGLTKRALKLAVGKLRHQDKVAITTYAGGVRRVLAPTSGRYKNRINAAIDGLETGGGTAMASGLELAYRQATQMLSKNSNTRIIVCSDGDANIGASSPDQILRSIQGYVKEGVTLSTIGFGDGNYQDVMMERLANRGNGNYYYIDSMRQAERVFDRDFTKMVQDVAQDVKIQVDFHEGAVHAYRLVGYENRDVADHDFRNDRVDAGEIGAGHQVTALYEITLKPKPRGPVATVRVRAKKPGHQRAKETSLDVPLALVQRPFHRAAEDFRFATAVLGGAELLRNSPYAEGWTYRRVISMVSDTNPWHHPDRAEFLSLMKKAARISGESQLMGAR